MLLQVAQGCGGDLIPSPWLPCSLLSVLWAGSGAPLLPFCLPKLALGKDRTQQKAANDCHPKEGL